MKDFQRGKSYRVGKREAGSSSMKIQWTRKPAPKVYDGGYLVDTAGISSAEEFFAKNQFNYPLNESFIIAEIEPETGDDMYFHEGTFLVAKQDAAKGLADPIPNISEGLARSSAAVERSHQERVADLKEQLKASNEINAANAKAQTDSQERYDRQISDLNKQLSKLKEENDKITRELQIELEVNKRMSDRLGEQGLADPFGFLRGLQPLLEPLGKHLIDRGLEKAGNVMKGMRRGPVADTNNQVIQNASDALELPDV